MFIAIAFRETVADFAFQPPPPPFPRNMACRICLTKQANIAKAEGKKKLACLSALYGKNIKFNKASLYGEIFYSYSSLKHGTFAPRSPRASAHTLAPKSSFVKTLFFKNMYSATYTQINVHTLVCQARRVIAEEIIITSKRCRIKCLSYRSVYVSLSAKLLSNFRV